MMKDFRTFMEMAFAKQNLKQQIKQVASALSDLVNPSAKKMMSAIPKAHDSSVPYWNNEQFLQWLEKNGIKHEGGVPNHIDGGAGRAYFIGDFVVKFTGNPVEAEVAKSAAGRSDLPTVVIDVMPLGNLFAILQHKVAMGDSIDKRIRDAADWLTLIVDEKPELVGFPSDPKKQEQLIQWVTEEGAPQDLYPFLKQVLVALADLYAGTGFKHDDAGPTNVGVHQNKIVFPDLGPNQTKDFSADNALSQIAANRASLGLN